MPLRGGRGGGRGERRGRGERGEGEGGLIGGGVAAEERGVATLVGGRAPTMPNDLPDVVSSTNPGLVNDAFLILLGRGLFARDLCRQLLSPRPYWT